MYRFPLLCLIAVMTVISTEALAFLLVRSGQQLDNSTHRLLAQEGQFQNVEVTDVGVTLKNLLTSYCGSINDEVTKDLMVEFMALNFGGVEAYEEEYGRALRDDLSNLALESDIIYAVPFCMPVYREDFVSLVRPDEALDAIALRETGFDGPQTKQLFVSANSGVSSDVSNENLSVAERASALAQELADGGHLIIPYRSQPVLFRSKDIGKDSADVFMSIIESDPGISESALNTYRAQISDSGQLELRETLKLQQMTPTQFFYSDDDIRIGIYEAALDNSAQQTNFRCVRNGWSGAGAADLFKQTCGANVEVFETQSQPWEAVIKMRGPAPSIPTPFSNKTKKVGNSLVVMPTETFATNQCSGQSYYTGFFGEMKRFDDVYQEQRRRMSDGDKDDVMIAIVDNGLDDQVFKSMDGQEPPLSIFPTRHFKLDTNECLATLDKLEQLDARPDSGVINRTLLLATRLDGNENGIEGDWFGMSFSGANGLLGYRSDEKKDDSRHGAKVLFSALGGVWDESVLTRMPEDMITEKTLNTLTEAQTKEALRNMCREEKREFRHKFINYGSAVSDKLLQDSDSFRSIVDYMALHQINVVNASFGSRNKAPYIQTAIKSRSDNMLFVVAGGNVPKENEDEDQRESDLSDLKDQIFPKLFPAKYGGNRDGGLPNVISVGGLGKDEISISDETFYSNKHIDVYAPSLKLPSTDRRGKRTCTSGTSMATGIVTYVAARIWALLQPAVAPKEIKQRLWASSTWTMGADGTTVVRSLNPIDAIHVFDDIIKLKDSRSLYGTLNTRKVGDYCYSIPTMYKDKIIKRLNVNDVGARSGIKARVYWPDPFLQGRRCELNLAQKVEFTRWGESEPESVTMSEIDYILTRERRSFPVRE